jgi:hypothetical protein
MVATEELMDHVDKLAEASVREAIEKLVAAGERPHSQNAPAEARQLLLAKGRGRISEAVAEKRVIDAIWRMKERKDIKAPTSPQGDWVIVDRSSPSGSASKSV